MYPTPAARQIHPTDAWSLRQPTAQFSHILVCGAPGRPVVASHAVPASRRRAVDASQHAWALKSDRHRTRERFPSCPNVAHSASRTDDQRGDLLHCSTMKSVVVTEQSYATGTNRPVVVKQATRLGHLASGRCIGRASRACDRRAETDLVDLPRRHCFDSHRDWFQSVHRSDVR